MNVVDSKNISYEVLKKLGEGSQGVTYLLKDQKHIVKLFKQSYDEITTKSKINFLINLRLDKKSFAIPLRQITQPKNGYISEYASGMTPLSSLKPGVENKNLKEWYLASGGLLKRYNVLIRLAALLRGLHSKGLAYCDLSPNNVFISERPDIYNVFLIDLDNLRYKTSIINNIYTPFYGAPEVIANNAPNTTMSDCYSFAVIAYELLTMNHPLIGDYVSEGDPDLEEQALTGMLPWVEHSEDLINYRTTGISSDKIMTSNILELFIQNFEEGLNHPMQRPSMAEWYDGLILAQNELLKCGENNCGWYYPYFNNRQCGCCGHQPTLVTSIKMRRWEEVEYFDIKTHTIKQHFALQPEVYDEIIVDENTPKEITALNFLLTDIDPLAPILQIKIIEGKCILIPLNGVKFKLNSRTGNPHPKTTEISTKVTLNLIIENTSDNNKYMLHLKDLNTAQRVLTID